jgi:hypothetical protein
MTIDSQCISFVIKSYLNFKTNFIAFINCLVHKKLNEMWESWKRSKMLLMFHWTWMGIAWGNMEDECLGLKHTFRNLTCFRAHVA